MLPTRIWRWAWGWWWWWCAPLLPVTIFPMTVGHNSWPIALSLSGEINSSGRQEVCRVLWDQKFHQHVHKSLALDPYLNQINRTSNFFKTHINIVLPSTPWSLKQHFPPCFSTKTRPTVLFTSMHAKCRTLSPHCSAVTLCTTFWTLDSSTFCPHSVFMCFVWFWEQTAIISLYSINWLVL